ncbi:hypothetical protein EV383_4418 [Pseudonocardia sediminis]|uniref:Uncharacterized protein n=1 Tax=Pseudonocardia sediminis TaxID=1397368 RepID=A0A4Q7V448_PSEST|nr:hypothetical protein [Pseudonocardia sediminis]RZT87493.1 hypothetical protein EV383_4418 [Pseudonocardia sediminis]
MSDDIASGDPTPRPLRYVIEVWNAPGHSTAESGVGTVEEVAAKLRAEADLLCPPPAQPLSRPDLSATESKLANDIATAITRSRPDSHVLFSTRFRAAYAAIQSLRDRDARAAAYDARQDAGQEP